MLDVVAQARRPCMCDKSPVSAPAGALAGLGLVDAVVASDGQVLMSGPDLGFPEATPGRHCLPAQAVAPWLVRDYSFSDGRWYPPRVW